MSENLALQSIQSQQNLPSPSSDLTYQNGATISDNISVSQSLRSDQFENGLLQNQEIDPDFQDKNSGRMPSEIRITGNDSFEEEERKPSTSHVIQSESQLLSKSNKFHQFLSKGDPCESLSFAIEALINCESVLGQMQGNEVLHLKTSALEQLKSAKDALVLLLDDINGAKNLNDSRNTNENVKKESSLEDNELEAQSDKEKNVKTEETEENKENNFLLDPTNYVKIEDLSADEGDEYCEGDEDYSPEEEQVEDFETLPPSKKKRSSIPNKKKRGRPKKGEKVLPVGEEEEGDMEDFNEIISKKELPKVSEKVKLSCPHCDKVYAAQAKSFQQAEQRLKEHIQKKHTNNFPCNKCSAILPSPEELKRHKHDHRRKKERICPICGVTVMAGSYTRHMSYHGEKKFHCEICGKSFHIKHKLEEHKRTHTGETPFGCEICGKAFTASRKLSRHKIVHTGEKPHVCVLCGKAFNQKNNLKTHMKSHASSGGGMLAANFDAVRMMKDSPGAHQD
eukprot:TRINITY_DN7761_c0_g1_i11.p1 TRINITY_DN7761_c0_g1~~TRINITY_DN7761_c0_g1_i11.p1  ORF type:complete len:509 (-),score=108.20 TRINITY_DN7761_c0_g1_i11:146-1672(-)